MQIVKKILIVQLIFLSFETYAQKYDTAYYSDESIRMITSKIGDKIKVLTFFNKGDRK